MKSLTLWRPWPWAFIGPATDPKRVENRPWKPWSSIIGERIALHAGAKLDEEAAYWMRERGLLVPAASVHHPQGVVAVVTVAGWIERRSQDGPPDDLVAWGPLVGGSMTEERALAAARSRWFFGPFGWVLDDVQALASVVQCPGAQGLWDLPLEVEERVVAQLRSAA